MSTVNRHAPHDIEQVSIEQVIRGLRLKGVKLWSERGQLRYRAPKGILSRQEIERLRISGQEILCLLEGLPDRGPVEPVLEPQSRSGAAPLTYSQLAHWQLAKLSNRCSLRHLVTATRLRGSFQLETLHRALSEVVRRHEALRARFILQDGVPLQIVDASAACEARCIDFSALPEAAREAELQRFIEQLILEPVRVLVDPLFVAHVVKLREQEHVLILSAEHLIADAVSMSLLRRELLHLYMQLCAGTALMSPQTTIQLADIAIWQRKRHEWWITQHEAYWYQRLGGCRRVRFPGGDHDAARPGWSSVPITIDKALKRWLSAWCREQRTTLVIGVMTIYLALVLRWCGTSQMLLRYQSDGRPNPKLAHTVGYLAAVLNLRIDAKEEWSLSDLLRAVTTEYCEAYARADYSYLDTQVPRPEYLANTAFNWIPHAPREQQSGDTGTLDFLSTEPVDFTNPVLRTNERDAEPSVLLYDTEDGIRGTVNFPNRFSAEIMDRFAHEFYALLERVPMSPQLRLQDIRPKPCARFGDQPTA